MIRGENILVTGGSGMVGTALQQVLPGAVYVSSRDCDLTDPKETLRLFKYQEPEKVIHLAARVGGVLANTKYIGDFYNENTSINLNVLEAARVTGVSKVLSLLSTCIYPDEVEYPLTEEQIHNGPPHESNYGYAYAKRMLDIQSRAYRQQYGCDYVTAVPNNLFGENDNFDLQNSHVIPAMIRKIYEATMDSRDVYLWGDGSPLREFTYSGDLASILVFLLDNYSEECPINIGNTEEHSIKEVAEIIAELIKFDGKIIWQTDMPSGQHRKPSDNSKFREICDVRYTDFGQALTKTCEWFIMNYPKIRGI